MKKKLTFLLLFFTSCSLLAQPLARQLLVDDFNTYIRLLEETHPDPYTAFGGRVEFKREAQQQRATIQEGTTAEQLQEVLTAFAARINDGHTSISIKKSSEDTSQASYLPVAFRVATNGLYVSSTTPTYSHLLGASLEAVNGVPVDTLLVRVKKFQSVENRYGAYQQLATGYLPNSKRASLLLGDISSLELGLVLPAKKKQTVQLSYVAKPSLESPATKLPLDEAGRLLYWQLLDNGKPVGYFSWTSMMSREVFEEQAISLKPEYVEKNLQAVYKHLQVEQPSSIDDAIRGIPALYENFSNMLHEMKAKGADYLIVDLRSNSGGMTPLCMPLLYMLYGDAYLSYQCDAEYDRRISPLLLQKWSVDSAEQLNEGWGTEYVLGDFIFSKLAADGKEQSIEEKRNDLSRIAYFKGIGAAYTKNLNGEPIHSPHVVVLVSSQTFSAAFHFLYYLTEIGGATVVGVPPRQAGNAFMESTNFTLPHTQIVGSISNSVQLFYPNDLSKGSVFVPDYAMTWKDFARYSFDPNAEVLYALDLIRHKKIGK